MSSFSEAALEQSIIELFQTQVYTYVPDESIGRDSHEVMLKDVLHTYLNTCYASEGITRIETEAATITGAPCRHAGGSRADVSMKKQST